MAILVLSQNPTEMRLIHLLFGFPFLASAQGQFYLGSDLMVFTYRRFYLPPFTASGILLGNSWPVLVSGEAYRLLLWSEIHLGYLIGRLGGLPIVPGITGGVAWRIDLPLASKSYLQPAFGLDAYYLSFRDQGGSSWQDGQIRPIVSMELGSSAALESLFVRYSFYPLPGTATKYAFSIGFILAD
ncbi:MAG: hypothetical protein NZ958_01505 [Bacteroidia bacterium]|nr:hypothetical protein [Bacteroidia bacterium]MDW8089341.1 hypothetical protein [Bacteroidia bacterium]